MLLHNFEIFEMSCVLKIVCTFDFHFRLTFLLDISNTAYWKNTLEIPMIVSPSELQPKNNHQELKNSVSFMYLETPMLTLLLRDLKLRRDLREQSLNGTFMSIQLGSNIFCST